MGIDNDAILILGHQIHNFGIATVCNLYAYDSTLDQLISSIDDSYKREELDNLFNLMLNHKNETDEDHEDDEDENEDDEDNEVEESHYQCVDMINLWLEKNHPNLQIRCSSPHYDSSPSEGYYFLSYKLSNMSSFISESITLSQLREILNIVDESEFRKVYVILTDNKSDINIELSALPYIW